jgi:hypothetical protein
MQRSLPDVRIRVGGRLIDLETHQAAFTWLLQASPRRAWSGQDD